MYICNKDPGSNQLLISDSFENPNERRFSYNCLHYGDHQEQEKKKSTQWGAFWEFPRQKGQVLCFFQETRNTFEIKCPVFTDTNFSPGFDTGGLFRFISGTCLFCKITWTIYDLLLTMCKENVKYSFLQWLQTQQKAQKSCRFIVPEKQVV